jgi:tetratricopeptide (TPR) repeat protein
MQTPSDADRDRCLDAETLAAYVDGLLPTDAIARADRHIDECSTCRGELSALAATSTFPLGGTPLESIPVVEGTLGRYEVQGEIGRGNMGVVVRAFDPELARSIAIKILAPKWAHGRDARDRLRREAQAMARLSHPNVVQVYDVTSQGDLLAIAMELVEGKTLRAAITAGTPWQDMLAICMRAGRGLAAAHTAKLIHRDYKPENVLCANDGRVLVGDFGLARLDGATPIVPSDAAPTTTTLAGTPAYIAPELFHGEPATTASDQFSFCVATYEALYGERPFAGAKLDELRANMASGIVRDAPAGAKVPLAIRHALVRGLSPDPSKRFASLEALLDALDARPRRRWPLIAGAGVLAIAASVVFVARGRSCDIEPLAWDRAGLTRALANSPDSARVLASIAAYERAWVAAKQEACEATRVRDELSERVLDARNACLARGRRELTELVTLVSRDPTLASHAVEAIDRLHDPHSCTPDVRSASVDPDIDRASALLAAGRSEDAIAIAKAVLARTRDGLTKAEALAIRGRAEGLLEQFEAAEGTLTEAVTAAEQVRADQLVSSIWVELVQVTGAQKHRFEAAQANMRAAEAAFARVEPGPALRGRYDYVVGAMLLARGSLDEARTHLDRSLLADERPLERGGIHGALCDVYRQQRKLDEARTHCETAIALMSSVLGPDHPKIAVIYNVWGTVELAAKKHDLAREKWAKAIEIFEKRQPADRGLALALSNTAVAWMQQGDIARARPLFERSRDLFAAHHPDHAQRVLPLQGLASVALETKDYRTAIASYEDALGVIERVYGKEDSRRITVLYNLAIAYQRLPDLDKARELVDEVIAQSQHPGREDWMMVAYGLDMAATIVEKQSKNWKQAIELRERALAALDHKDDPSVRAWIDTELGRVLRTDNQIARSVAPLERAVAYYTAHPTHLYDTGVTKFRLAKSLWDTNKDRRRAVALARAASSDLAAAKSGLNLEPFRTEIAEWLRTHR